jgi:membrane fusion protein (multidrug efflux system)
MPLKNATIPMVMVLIHFCTLTLLSAQPPAEAPPADPNQVTIKREALNLIPPEKYKVQLTIFPQKYLEIISTNDGTVEYVNAKPGDKLREQSEIIRIDSIKENLLLNKAKAEYETGKIKIALAKENKGGYQLEIVQEELKALKANLDLVQLEFDRKIIRAPFEGRLNSLLVSQGQFIKHGQILATFGDNSQLMVQIPVDRQKVKEGDDISFKVESAQVTGKIQVINPLTKEFEPLREIIASPASATVFVDNTNGSLAPGQSVFVDLVPSFPVTKVPNSTVANMPATGDRKVQIIRENTIRDINVKIFAAVGDETTYLSGPFKAGDELVITSSVPLTDGTEVTPTMLNLPGAAPVVAPTPRANF